MSDYIFPPSPTTLGQLPPYLVDLTRSKDNDPVQYEVVNSFGDSQVWQGVDYPLVFGAMITLFVNHPLEDGSHRRHSLVITLEYVLKDDDIQRRFFVCQPLNTLDGWVDDPAEVNLVAILMLRAATFLRTLPHVLEECLPLAAAHWEQVKRDDRRHNVGTDYITRFIGVEFGIDASFPLHLVVNQYMKRGQRKFFLAADRGVALQAAGLLSSPKKGSYEVTDKLLERMTHYKDQWVREGEPGV